MIYELVLRNFDCSLEFGFSLLLLQPFNFSPVSFACNFQDCGCIILREIDFLLKICWSIPCLHPSWKVHTWRCHKWWCCWSVWIRADDAYFCYRQVLPDQWILVYKINSTEKPISLTKVTATTKGANQWKVVFNPLPRQYKLASCYPRTITSSFLSKTIAKQQQKVTWILPNGQSWARNCMWPEAYLLVTYTETWWHIQKQKHDWNKKRFQIFIAAMPQKCWNTQGKWPSSCITGW